MSHRPKLYALEPATKTATGTTMRSPLGILFKSWAPSHVCSEETNVDGILRRTLGRVQWLGPPLQGKDYTVDTPVRYYIYRVRCTLCGLEDEITSYFRLCIGGSAAECARLGFNFDKELAAGEAAERFR